MTNRHGRAMHRLGATAIAITMLVTGCADDSMGTSGANNAGGQSDEPKRPTTPIGDAEKDSTFKVTAGIEYVAAEDAQPGADIAVVRNGTEVDQTVVDRFGSAMFFDIEPGDGYEVRQRSDDGTITSTKDVHVMTLDEHPDEAAYKAHKPLVDGFQYITARDGVKIAVTVRPPLGKSLDDGPYPTVINMSGYADADPYGTGPPMAQVAGALGYATVSVNSRGTGCSGGVNQLFDETWAADGYDVVETVAAQEWAKKVGLVGISFPGITQLFTAGTNPPHLAAINPIAVLTDVYRSPGYIGGIFNNGFTEGWLTDRQNDAKPAPEAGQGYATRRIQEDGDTQCLENQKLRNQTQNIMGIIDDNPYRNPDLIEERSPMTWAPKISVPVLMMNAWQDEQVGSDSANLLDVLPDRRDVKATFTNGVHSSPLDPVGLAQLAAFLDIYVAERVPDVTNLPLIGGVLYDETLIKPETQPEPVANAYAGMTTLAEAKEYFEAQPRLMVTFDSGGDPATPGIPNVGHSAGFSDYPPAESKVARWFFGEDGALASDEPTGGDDAFDRYFPTSTARPMQTIPGQGQSESWEVLPAYDWRPLVENTAVAYLSEPFETDTTIVGSASADLWLRLNSEDTDLQVTMTEVRPDGTEVYVQSGWLRASHRALDEKRSTETRPWPTHAKEDAAPMPIDEWEKVRVATDPVGFTFRKGSKLRVSVAAVGGDRTRWSFETPFNDPDNTVEVGRSADHPSSIALPVLDTIDAPDAYPACPGLRGQPCRTYEPAANGG